MHYMVEVEREGETKILKTFPGKKEAREYLKFLWYQAIRTNPSKLILDFDQNTLEVVRRNRIVKVQIKNFIQSLCGF